MDWSTQWKRRVVLEDSPRLATWGAVFADGGIDDEGAVQTG
jgi:hypothetical protein